MRVPRRETAWWRCGTALVLVSVLGACGSRLSIGEIRRDALGVSLGGSQTPGGGSGSDQGIGLGTGTPGAVPGASQGPGGGGAIPGLGGGGTSGGAASAANKAPIILGSVSTMSGPAGAAQAPGVRAYQAWVRAINDSGGIAGHPIKFFVADDSADPTRHGALVRDMVENKHVIGFFNFASQSNQGASDYLLERRVPVVGGDSSIDLWWSNPMYFPELGNFGFTGEGLLRMAMRFPKTNGRRLGILVCREAAVCSDAADDLRKAAQKLGWTVASDLQGSIGQPDYTPQCIAAKGANVNFLVPVFDNDSIKRVARDCGNQAFHPQYGTSSVDDTFTSSEFEGGVQVGPYPYMDTGNAAIVQMRRAMAKFAPDVPLGTVVSQGWMSAKMMEKVLRTIAASGGSFTSKSILDVLWTFRNETVGGLFVPRTFVRDKPTERLDCVFGILNRNGRYVAPDGGKYFCGG